MLREKKYQQTIMLHLVYTYIITKHTYKVTIKRGLEKLMLSLSLINIK